VRTSPCPVPWLGPGATTPNSKLGADTSTPGPTTGPSATMPSSTLGEDTSTPSPTLGPGATMPNSMLGADESTPSYLLGLVRELTPTSLRLGVKLKSHSTLSLQYPKPELIIMMPIITPLNTNKQPMLILIICDDTSNKIILFYYYKITSLSLLCCIK